MAQMFNFHHAPRLSPVESTEPGGADTIIAFEPLPRPWAALTKPYSTRHNTSPGDIMVYLILLCALVLTGSLSILAMLAPLAVIQIYLL